MMLLMWPLLLHDELNTFPLVLDEVVQKLMVIPSTHSIILTVSARICLHLHSASHPHIIIIIIIIYAQIRLPRSH